jgi:hypothetical protein
MILYLLHLLLMAVAWSRRRFVSVLCVPILHLLLVFVTREESCSRHRHDHQLTRARNLGAMPVIIG